MNRPKPLRRLVFDHLRRDQPAEASAAVEDGLRETVAGTALHAEALGLLAMVEEHEGNLPAAIAAHERAAAIDPTDAEGAEHILVTLGAFAVLLRSAGHDGDEGRILARQAQLAERWLPVAGRSRVEACLKLALFDLRQGRPEEAARLIERLIGDLVAAGAPTSPFGASDEGHPKLPALRAYRAMARKALGVKDLFGDLAGESEERRARMLEVILEEGPALLPAATYESLRADAVALPGQGAQGPWAS